MFVVSEIKFPGRILKPKSNGESPPKILSITSHHWIPMETMDSMKSMGSMEAMDSKESMEADPRPNLEVDLEPGSDISLNQFFACFARNGSPLGGSARICVFEAYNSFPSHAV